MEDGVVRECCHSCGEQVKREGFNRRGYLVVSCKCTSREPCPFCKSQKGTVHVQGHDQCVDCKQVIDSCCTGESQEIQSDT